MRRLNCLAAVAIIFIFAASSQAAEQSQERKGDETAANDANAQTQPKTETRADSNGVTIPLDEIWAYDMPGTRGVAALDAAKEPTGVTAQPVVNQIVTALASRHPKEGENVGPAFIVRGTGKKILENARAVLTNTVEPTKAFSPETDLTLVFYSVIGAPYVHIASVEKSDHKITVKYRFVLHSTRDDSLHFALIPLGQLREGKYEIRIERLELTDMKSWVQAAIPKFERAVCSGTSFTVRKEKP